LVWVLITHSGRIFEQHLLEPFLSSVRPRCTRPILQTDQIRSLINKVEALPETRELRVRQVGSRAKIKSKGASKVLESDRRWTDLSVEEAFGELRSEGHWITDATVQFRYLSIPNASIKITRYGKLAFRKIAGAAFSSCVSTGALLARKTYEFLHGRARSKNTGYQIRPFNIEFGIPIFDSRQQIHLLQSALRKIPSVTCTTLHGNPYFHAVMVDYYDGSSYEVLVINPNHLTVIPQGRSTVSALQRLCAAVFYGFREGDLREVSSER
jgi:hypothetical protein